MFFLGVLDEPFPEVIRFGVRVVHAENAHTVLDPKDDNAFKFSPHCLPTFALKIERVDIFIFFRRVFRVLNASVRAMFEPFWMAFNVRMVRRALKS